MSKNNVKFILSPVYCIHNGAVVLEQENDSVRIGLVDSKNELLKSRLAHAVKNKLRVFNSSDSFGCAKTKTSAEFVTITQEEFTQKISELYSLNNKSNALIETESENKEVSTLENENVTAALLNSIISRARKNNATDIHIEGNSIRFRIQGVLKKELNLDEKNAMAVIRRIKLLAKMNVLESRHGQDGQFVYTDEKNNNVFIRVSSVPAVSCLKDDNSESVVLRLLDTARIPLRLENLGFNESQVEVLNNLCNLENGLILICGPTGSGKSTTAASLLERIQKNKNESKKIVSLEDPPEYILQGVTQIQIKSNDNMDFAEALRRTFRQDPDVIFIGEIRDSLTSKIAVQAALTGHLVFATIHVGTISQAVLRLYDLGEDPALVNEVLRAIVVQHFLNGKMEGRIRVLKEKYGAEEKNK